MRKYYTKLSFRGMLRHQKKTTRSMMTNISAYRASTEMMLESVEDSSDEELDHNDNVWSGDDNEPEDEYEMNPEEICTDRNYKMNHRYKRIDEVSYLLTSGDGVVSGGRTEDTVVVETAEREFDSLVRCDSMTATYCGAQYFK